MNKPASRPARAPQLEETGPGQLRISGDLTFASVAALWQASQHRLSQTSGDITIDLAGIRKADSAGLALLVEWLRLARQHHRRLRFANLPAQLVTMAKTYNLDALLPDAHG